MLESRKRRAIDIGATWTPQIATLGSHVVSSISYYAGTFFLGDDSSSSNAELSNDNGADWSSVSGPAGYWADGAGSVGNPGIVAGETSHTSQHMLYSLNDSTWLSSTIPGIGWASGDVASGYNKFIVPDNHGLGVAVSSDGGASWTVNLLPGSATGLETAGSYN